MNEIAIQIKNISKEYNYRRQAPYSTLTETITNSVLGKFKKIQDFNEQSPVKFWALKDISSQIEPGEIVGIIGRNGAGKSTLLKILSRITLPTEGTIQISGRVGSLLEVGTGFHPELSGRENIFLNGSILGLKKKEIEEKFSEIVKFSEIEKFLDTPVKRYSSGMYVRLAFAVAAFLEPEILLVDEVLAVGDAVFQKKCLGKMNKIANEGRTILFVSHNMAAVKSMCSRVILLDEGKVHTDSTAELAINEYFKGITGGVYQRKWDKVNAPGNNSAIIKEIFATNTNGDRISDIFTNTSFNIQIIFEVVKPNSFVGLTLLFSDSENNLIFSSICNNEKEWYGTPMPKGEYMSSCRIPGNFFNNKDYLISVLLFGKNFTDSHLVREVLRIEIQDSAAIRGDFFGEFGGTLRPLLLWKTELINKK